MLARLKIDQHPPSVIIDPCCGSGTILIEACMRLNQIAPQRQRLSNQLSRWTGLERISWTDLVATTRLNEIQPRHVFWDLISMLRRSTVRAPISSVQDCLIEFLLSQEIESLSPATAQVTNSETVWILGESSLWYPVGSK